MIPQSPEKDVLWLKYFKMIEQWKPLFEPGHTVFLIGKNLKSKNWTSLFKEEYNFLENNDNFTYFLPYLYSMKFTITTHHNSIQIIQLFFLQSRIRRRLYTPALHHMCLWMCYKDVYVWSYHITKPLYDGEQIPARMLETNW